MSILTDNLTGNILISGSARGIGASIAEIWCRKNENNMYYGLSKWNDIDVTNENNVNVYINSFLSEENIKLLPIALVNNAGIAQNGSILEMTQEEWKHMFDVNVNGVFNCTKAYVNLCKVKNIPGKIINIASTAGLGARPGRSCYAATKAAIINFSLSMAEELKCYGIKVYCICPGPVNTDMRKHISPDDDFNKMLQPKDVALTVCDLITNGKNLDNQVITIKR